MKEPRALCMTGLLCAFLCHAAYPFWPGRPLGCVCPGHGFAPQRSHLYHGAARSYTVRRRFRRDVLWHVEWHVRARRGMSGGWVAWRGTRGCCTHCARTVQIFHLLFYTGVASCPIASSEAQGCGTECCVGVPETKYYLFLLVATMQKAPGINSNHLDGLRTIHKPLRTRAIVVLRGPLHRAKSPETPKRRRTVRAPCAHRAATPRASGSHVASPAVLNGDAAVT